MKTLRPLNVFLAVTGLLLLLSPLASAQTPLPAIGTITVTVEGYATAPADTAYVVVVLGKDVGFIDSAREQIPGLEADVTPVDPAPVIDALVASGVVASDISQVDGVFQGEWGPGQTPPPATLVVTVSTPTPEAIVGMQNVVMDSAHAEGYFVNSFNVLYAVNDCQTLRNNARIDAVATARTEAEAQAAAMDVTLGDVLASRDVQPMSTMGWQPSNCVRGFEIDRAITTYGIAAFDPNMPAEVTIWIGLEVTFEIP